MIELSPDEVRALRTRAQYLHTPLPRERMIDSVRAVCGVQAQLSPAMMLALRARVSGLKAGDVEAAIADSRRLVRTWAMRGTLHLLAAEDVRWLVALLGPIFAAGDRRRRLELGLDEDLSAAGLRAIRAILSDEGPLTRHELAERLAERDVLIERKGQALIHLISQAAFEQIVCLGPDRQGGKSTYALLDRWVEPQESMPRETVLAELARRYLTGYGPADLKDFAGWSGLKKIDAKTGWEQVQEANTLVEMRVGERTLRSLSSPTAFTHSDPIVRLLPAFDTYILGYTDRDDLVRPEAQREVYHGGQTVPVVLVNGLAAGVWRYDRQPKRLKITVRAFDRFDGQVQHLIAEEAEDIGRFWDMPMSLTFQR